jgi:hypothetical protein
VLESKRKNKLLKLAIVRLQEEIDSKNKVIVGALPEASFVVQ